MRAGQDVNLDQGSSTVWDVANVLEAGGLAAGFFGVAKIGSSATALAAGGLGLLVTGLVIRWTAIRTLGRYFVGTVTIQSDHQLVRHGLYRRIRHPAYTGTLVAHLGLGVAFTSWVSVALSTVPFGIAALCRMRIEEAALRQRFGAAFQDYERESWRLIPGLY